MGTRPQGMRQTEGFAVREVMDAYDWASNTIAKLYLRVGEPGEIRRLLDDLAALHDRAWESLREFNQSSIIRLEGPAEKAKPEHLVHGRIAAMLAMAEGNFDEVRRLAAAHDGPVARKELRTLQLRAEIAAGRGQEARALLQALHATAERRDDCAQECELAVLNAQRAPEDAGARLALAEAYLPRAAACAGSACTGGTFKVARALALCDLGRLEEARSAADAALSGTEQTAGAYDEGDRTIAPAAVSALESAGGTVPEGMLAGAQVGALVPGYEQDHAGPHRRAKFIL